MNATATKGIWQEKLSDTVTMQFDTTHKPERITVQEVGKNPVHFDLEDGIEEADIYRVRDFVKKTYKL
jgi:hypothetical protein